jgi:hypothetical protein
MGMRAGLLMAVHVFSCAVAALFSWILLALDESEETEGQGSGFEATVLSLALLVLGVGVWIALAKGSRRRLAVLLVVAEAVIGILIWRALDTSVNDFLIQLAALIIVGSGLGAAALARPGRRVPV